MTHWTIEHNDGLVCMLRPSDNPRYTNWPLTNTQSGLGDGVGGIIRARVVDRLLRTIKERSK